jgi:hypothetical protein
MEQRNGVERNRKDGYKVWIKSEVEDRQNIVYEKVLKRIGQDFTSRS